MRLIGWLVLGIFFLALAYVGYLLAVAMIFGGTPY